MTTKKIRRFFLFSFFSLFLSAALAFSALAADADAKTPLSPPAQFVQKLGDTALMSLTAKNVARPAREQRVREILQKNFDIQTIGRFSLGTYWNNVSAAQRTEYLSLFEDMIVQTYTTRFEDYSGQKLKVKGATASGDRDFIVSSQVIQKDGPPVNLEWRVRSKDGDLRVIDVVVEGVSMSVTQRSDFAAVIQRGGGSIDVLLSTLRDRKKNPSQKKS